MDSRKSDLLRYLNEARDAVVWKLDGLDEYTVRRPATPTGTNLLGLVKHLTSCELLYFARTFDRPSADLAYLDTFDPWENEDMWAGADEQRDELVARYRRVGAHSDRIVTELPLDTRGRVPHWPRDRADITLHHVVVRMLGETHRHAGQADVIREGFDGAAGHREGSSSLPSEDRAWWERYVGRVESAARQASR
ncbi:DinB family protein [Pseudonocardia sp. ICBG1293]|uniref:DinB family protein n=1 Tax=Pseudonocardia sp. ICBG1293 TaxID=2844382 RepID=UPI001CCDD84B|nr:DinB family protein [Pseudonocardia sp. ICBG1293]